MNTFFWILQILLGFAVLGAGTMKLAKDRAALLANKQMAWASDFSAEQIKLIGLAEVSGSLGLILPYALGVMPILTPLAALGIAVLLSGAVLTHLRRRESPALAGGLVLLAVVIAVGRFAT